MGPHCLPVYLHSPKVFVKNAAGDFKQKTFFRCIFAGTIRVVCKRVVMIG